MYRFVCFFFLIALAVVAQAQPLTPEQVPEPLKPWIAWVQEDKPQRACPFLYNNAEDKRCSWATSLALSLSAAQGVFTGVWQVYSDSWQTLPGDSKHWPLNVTVNDKTALVMERDGLPVLKLAAGVQRVKGEFFWDSLPDNLTIPADMGLITLQVNNQTIAAPTIKDAQLWLKDSIQKPAKPENIQNNVTVQVFRRIEDDVPVQVLTHIDLEVSGEQREITLEHTLLPDFIPLQLQSALPARLDANGKLVVQVRAGRWQIDVLARNTKELTSLTLPQSVGLALASKATEVAPTTTAATEDEVWVFAAHPELRVVEIEQLSAIDASQTNLPDDWRSLPAYRISAGQTMGFKVIRRGDPEPEPNQLNLTRKLWLDFDGGGYTVNDTINGTMTSGWRLNALPSTKLGKVTLDGNSQLITHVGTAEQGVEVRKGMINLDADSRMLGAIDNISAVGWQQNFHNVTAELNLPPGWRLVAASGVDNVPDSWLARWTLLDLFLVLITALAVGRLWHPAWGGLALVTLAICWHEDGAPQFIWLNILAAIALLSVLPQGKFYKFVRWYRNGCCLVLVGILLPFMINQVRIGIYPQLERPWQDIHAGVGGGEYRSGLQMPAAPAPVATMMDEALLPESAVMAPRKAMRSTLKKDKSEYYVSSYDRFERVDPKAKVQTGPGLPQWQWHTIQLSWNGAVTTDQQLKLWYLSPALTMLLNFLRVIFVSVLALLLFGVAEKIKPHFPKFRSSTPLALIFLLLPLLFNTPLAYADYPSEAMLSQLKNRLQQIVPPDCLPSCAQIQQMQLRINGQDMSIQLQIHAQANVALPLPSDSNQWFPNEVLDNGKPATALSRDNQLWINVAQGDHAVVLKGVTPLLSKFTLPLPLKPHRVSLDIAKSDGNGTWEVVGLQEDGLADEQLQFSRVQQSANLSQSKEGIVEQSALPPFVRVERTLQLGLDWRVVTEINRISPADSPIVLNVPLLKGESVLTAGIRVKNNAVEVNMAAQQVNLRWESTLEKSAKIELIAPETAQWLEVWRADISPVWHIDNTGIAMMHLNSEGRWLPEWHPWSGEKVNLQITRPEAVTGKTLTIDNSDMQINQGQRLREVTLTASLRSSQGMQHTLTLPDKALLQSVAINGQNQPLRQEGRKLTLPISPNKQQVTLSWQESVAISPVLTSSLIDVGQDSVNNNLTVNLGSDRWVLFATGPRFGPIILFWGMLVVMAIVALGLGKVPLTPLKHWHWFLLLIGLSQVAIESAGVVIGWLMLLGWRQQGVTSESRYFNLLQVTLSLATLFSLGILFAAVAQGLLDAPDMQITGNRSSAFALNWYSDRSPAQLPTATIISLPLIVYRLLMLAWSLWLAVSLLNWLKWGWSCFSNNGLWYKKPVKQPQTSEVADDGKN